MIREKKNQNYGINSQKFEIIEKTFQDKVKKLEKVKKKKKRLKIIKSSYEVKMSKDGEKSQSYEKKIKF